MSALFGLRNSRSIYVVSDAAYYSLADGVVCGIAPKQHITPNGILVAGGGHPAPAVRFAHVAAARRGFDEVVQVASEVWAESLSSRDGRMPCVLLFAGWSEERQRVEMHAFNTPAEGATEQFPDYDVFAVGPNVEPLPCIGEFIQRFTDETAREGFDPRDHGLPLMEKLRRYPKEFGRGTHSAVGGFCQVSMVGSGGIATTSIHSWPDLIGEPISLDGETEWRAPFGVDFDQFHSMRKMLVRRWWRSGGSVVEGVFGVEKMFTPEPPWNTGIGAALGGIAVREFPELQTLRDSARSRQEGARPAPF